MSLNVGKEVAALQRMSVPELRARYAEVFGETTRVRHKAYLVKRIIWRLQAIAEGDLSERAKRRAAELANDADLRLTAPAPKSHSIQANTERAALSPTCNKGMPMAGAVLTRSYKGRLIQVTVRHDGFEFDGDVYRSLSAVAKAITGTHWNGYHFFGLRKEEHA